MPHRTGARHVLQMVGDGRQVLRLRLRGKCAVFVAVGSEKSLFQRHTGGAVRRNAIADMGVAVVQARDDDQRTVVAIKLVTRLAQSHLGNAIAGN